MNLQLVFPTETYEREWYSIVKEIEDAGEKMTPYSLKACANDYSEYLKATRDVSCYMNRIAIIGCGGTGKSTLARRLGKITGLPVYHLDALYWKPGWVPMPEKEWDLVMTQLTSKKEWIIDGNYGRTMDIRIREADTVIFLDYPTYISVFRVLKRRIQYHSKTRPDMGKGCTEKLDLQFIKWIWNFRKDKRPELLKKLGRYKLEKQVYVFTKPRQLKRFLEGVSQICC